MAQVFVEKENRNCGLFPKPAATGDACRWKSVDEDFLGYCLDVYFLPCLETYTNYIWSNLVKSRGEDKSRFFDGVVQKDRDISYFFLNLFHGNILDKFSNVLGLVCDIDNMNMDTWIVLSYEKVDQHFLLCFRIFQTNFVKIFSRSFLQSSSKFKNTTHVNFSV